MTTDEIKIACAEASGWTPHSLRDANAMWFRPNEKHRLLERTALLPDYPGSADVAVTLCDLLASEGWHCALNNGLNKSWECTFTRHSDGPNSLAREPFEENMFYGCGDTMAMAICMAFLCVKGLWKEDGP